MTIVRTPPAVFDGFVNERGDLDGTSRAPRLCGCGCGTPMTAVRGGAIYASAACRTRAYRRRRQKPAEVSQKRHRPRKPDLRVSYRKAVAAVAPYCGSVERAAFALRPLLSDRQRAHLDREAA